MLIALCAGMQPLPLPPLFSINHQHAHAAVVRFFNQTIGYLVRTSCSDCGMTYVVAPGDMHGSIRGRTLVPTLCSCNSQAPLHLAHGIPSWQTAPLQPSVPYLMCAPGLSQLQRYVITLDIIRSASLPDAYKCLPSSCVLAQYVPQAAS